MEEKDLEQKIKDLEKRVEELEQGNQTIPSIDTDDLSLNIMGFGSDSLLSLYYFISDSEYRSNVNYLKKIKPALQKQQVENFIATQEKTDFTKEDLLQERSDDSKDKIFHMFEESSNYSSSEFQTLWANLISQEVKNPGDVSRKLINTVKDFDKDIMEYIHEVFKEVIYLKHDLMILPANLLSDALKLEHYDLTRVSSKELILKEDISKMISHGLFYPLIDSNLDLIQFRVFGKIDDSKDIKAFLQYTYNFELTKTGKELYRLLIKNYIDIDSNESLESIYNTLQLKTEITLNNTKLLGNLALVKINPQSTDMLDANIIYPKALKGINCKLYMRCEHLLFKQLGTDTEDKVKSLVEEFYKKAEGTQEQQFIQLVHTGLKFGFDHNFINNT